MTYKIVINRIISIKARRMTSLKISQFDWFWEPSKRRSQFRSNFHDVIWDDVYDLSCNTSLMTSFFTHNVIIVGWIFNCYILIDWRHGYRTLSRQPVGRDCTFPLKNQSIDMCNSNFYRKKSFWFIELGNNLKCEQYQTFLTILLRRLLYSVHECFR